MAVIFANCPSCLHQFSLELGEVKSGRRRFTVLCSNCEYYIKFDYRLIMAPGSKTDLKSEEIGEVVALRSKESVEVRFRRGTFLIENDRLHLKEGQL